MKSCVGCHSFVVILIGNCEVTSCGMCFWYLDPTNDVSDGYRTLVSSAWPVKGFAWSMQMHELDSRGELRVPQQFLSLLFSRQRVFCSQHKGSFVFKHLCQYCIVLNTKGLLFSIIYVLFSTQRVFYIKHLCIVLDTKGLLY